PLVTLEGHAKRRVDRRSSLNTFLQQLFLAVIVIDTFTSSGTGRAVGRALDRCSREMRTIVAVYRNRSSRMADDIDRAGWHVSRGREYITYPCQQQIMGRDRCSSARRPSLSARFTIRLFATHRVSKYS